MTPPPTNVTTTGSAGLAELNFGLAEAHFTAWVEGCTTLDALRDAAAPVNRMSEIVRRRLEALTAAAKTSFRVGARVVLTEGRKSGGGSEDTWEDALQDRDTVGTIIKMTAKYAHVSLDNHDTVRVGFIGIEPLPITDPRYSEAARQTALDEAKQHAQQALDQATEWRKTHVTVLGVTDEQRTKLEERIEKDLVSRL